MGTRGRGSSWEAGANACEDRGAILQQSVLFRDMPQALVRHAATHVVERRLNDGEALFLKHDPDDFVAFVVSGRVYSVMYGPDGRELIINSTEPGDVVGETALVESGVRESAAFACGHTRIFILGRRHFPELTKEPLFLQRLLMLLRLKLREAAAFVESVCLYRLESRLARYLVSVVDRCGRAEFGGVVVPLPPSQSSLAAMVNASRPKLNAQLQTWRRNGLVTWTQDKLLIVDVDQLRYMANVAGG